MAQFCIACDRKLDLISNNEDSHASTVCECGVINQIEYTDAPKRQLNVILIKNKMIEILKDKSFEKIDEKTKQEIVEYASKIGTHVTHSLKCFALIFIESKNLIYVNDEFSIKKRQRKNAIQILVNINKNEPTIFVRTPLTYIQTYAHQYSSEERQMYIDISECLLFLNACNKKNMQIIYEKIHKAILEYRHIDDITLSATIDGVDESAFWPGNVDSDQTKPPPFKTTPTIINNVAAPDPKQQSMKTSNLNNIIRFIALNKLNVNDLIYAEHIFIKNSITSFNR